MPTGIAARDNEVKQRRNFSEKHFPGVAPCGFRLVGHDGGAVWDAVRDGVIHDWAMTKTQRGGASPVYVTRFGEP